MREKTYRSECPDNVDSRSPVVRSQTMMNLSDEPLAKELGFVGWKATLSTAELQNSSHVSTNHFLLPFEI